MLKRADMLLVESGLAPSRERAKALIMEGVVYYGEVKVMKGSDQFPEDASLTVRENPIPFVSRGGLKLDKAVRKYGIDLNGAVCVDVGASTGGFTDCMLQNGARHVYAVDVGYGQLAWSVRTDPRVVCMERCNIRYVTPDQVPDKLDLAVIDVSFISLRLVLPAVQALLKVNAEVVALIKPQFEAGREKVGKKGVVREASTHIEVIKSTIAFAKSIGFGVKGLTFSPIRGPEGNIEFLVWLSRTEDTEVDPAAVVAEAHSQTIK